MYRTTKTDLDNCKKEKGDSLQRLEKYQKRSDESPSVSKYKRKIEKHNMDLMFLDSQFNGDIQLFICIEGKIEKL
jgi:Holliday junction resolvase RusA-like endonuclease